MSGTITDQTLYFIQFARRVEGVAYKSLQAGLMQDCRVAVAGVLVN